MDAHDESKEEQQSHGCCFQFPERYLRYRFKLQIFANYAGIIGATFFALQNLTTNWGGTYMDDSSITDAVKADRMAGMSWAEQSLRMGALQVAWLVYLLGAELQGNLSAGRYKRIMTWMVNFPVIIFMFGNIILSAVRTGDNIESTSANVANIVIGIIFLLLSLACIIYYGTAEYYKSEPWLNVVCGKIDTYTSAERGSKNYHNNRSMPQFFLHLFALACLIYFIVTGLFFYGTGTGWLLTDFWMQNAYAVEVWDAGGASVGMLALPVFFMMLGFELQGDLPPNNFKPLAVWVGCMNTFATSIFMYATTWDSFDNGLITTYVPPMIIMIILCVWAIGCVCWYNWSDAWYNAIWLKPLADPHPEEPKAFKSVAPAPVVQKEDRVQVLVSKAHEQKAVPKWGPEPHQVRNGYRHAVAQWQPCPDIEARFVEYKVGVEQPLEGPVANPREEHIVLGTQPVYVLDHFSGVPIDPDSKFKIDVDYRDTRDPEAPWTHGDAANTCNLSTRRSTLPYGWKVQPKQVEAGSGHVKAKWDGPPGVNPAAIEYFTTISKAGTRHEEEGIQAGTANTLNITRFNNENLYPGDELELAVKFRYLTDADEPEGGWQHEGNCPLTTRSDNLPDDWKIAIHPHEVGTRHIDVGWTRPPGTDAADLEYRFQARDAAGHMQDIVLLGEHANVTISELDGHGLEPDEEVQVVVSYRHKADAHEAGGGWQHSSDRATLRTRPEPEHFKHTLTLRDATAESVRVGWDARPNAMPEEVEYQVTVREGEVHTIVPGEQRAITVTEADGAPLNPDQTVHMRVVSRLRADAQYPDGGWHEPSASDYQEFSTARPSVGDFTLKPRQTGAGGGHVDVAWAKVPNLPEDEIEYRLYYTNAAGERVDKVLPGSENSYTIDNFNGEPLTPGQELFVNVQYRYKRDASHDDGGWEEPSPQLNAQTNDDDLPAGWRIDPHAGDLGTHHVTVAWEPIENVEPDSIEYKVIARRPGSEAMQQWTLPGAYQLKAIETLNGERLEEGEEVLCTVAFRHRADADEPFGGWQRESEVKRLATMSTGLPEDWGVQPTQRTAGSHHIVAEWGAPPQTSAEDIEYLVRWNGPADDEWEQEVVAGNLNHFKIDELDDARLEPNQEVVVQVGMRMKVDEGESNEGWCRFGTCPMRTGSLGGYVAKPRVTAVDTSGAALEWDAPEGIREEEVEYRVVVRDVEHTKTDVTIIPAHKFRIDDLEGDALTPGQEVEAAVETRLRADKEEDNEGWGPASEVVTAKLARPSAPEDWTPAPYVKTRGAHSLVAEWEPMPNVAPEHVEYRVTVSKPGEEGSDEYIVKAPEHRLPIEAFQGRTLQPGEELEVVVEARDTGADEPAWGYKADPKAMATESDGLPNGWRMTCRQKEAGSKHIIATWTPPPSVPTEDLQYRLSVAKPDGSGEEKYIVTGTTQHRIVRSAGRDLRAGDKLVGTIEYRHTGDAEGPAEGWQRLSLPAPLHSAPAIPDGWRVEPTQTEATMKSVSAEWQAPPGFDDEDVEYSTAVCLPSGERKEDGIQTETSLTVKKLGGKKLTPEQAIMVNVAFRIKQDALYDDGGWRGHSGPVQMSTAPAVIPDSYRMKPTVTEEDLADIIVDWPTPTYGKPEELDYRFTVKEHDKNSKGEEDEKDEKEDIEAFVLPGEQHAFMIDEFGGQPINPGELFTITLQYRYKKDADQPGGGWKGHSGPVTVKTKNMVKPAALLRSRVPRIMLLQEIMFQSNKAVITSGRDALPEVASILRKYPDMKLKVEGHVNFGQKEHAAIKLSKQRAERVCLLLSRMDIDQTRLTPEGFGYTRFRFPRGSPFTKKNRRVEFVLQEGSEVYEELAAEARARKEAVIHRKSK